MVELKLYKDLWIKVKYDDFTYMKDLKNYFTEKVEGYMFMPKYKSGQWNGEVSLFKNNSFPFGLVKDFIRFHKKKYKDIPLNWDERIFQLFKGDDIEIDYSLKYFPYDFQKKCIEDAIKYRNNITVVGTSGGKSNILAYIFKGLYENKIISNVILVVPTINLVTQFKSDLIEYGIDKSLVGELYGDKKETDKTILISTWQSLHNNLDLLQWFDCIFIDECLHSDTKITLPNNKKKKISDIKINDKIISYNIKKNQFEEDIVLKVHKNLFYSSKEDFYELEFDNGEILKVTGNHKILTKNKGYVRADSLLEEDEVIEKFL